MVGIVLPYRSRKQRSAIEYCTCSALDSVIAVCYFELGSLKPSFFTLFKRGRYFRLPPPSEDEDADVVRVRKEAERFAAAAVGFCMRHNPKFARHFLSKVCNIPVPSKIKVLVEVEPESWADLFIRIGRSVCVVEFKLGAALQPHQNPSSPAFWSAPTGYGAKVETAFAKSPKHFVVLGHPRYILFPQRALWTFQRAGWDLLAKEFESHFTSTRLLCDLRDCLAQFNVWEFSSMKTRDLSIYGPNVVHGSVAWEMLEQVYLCPDLKFSRGRSAYRLDSEVSERNAWYFGIEIQSVASKTVQALLRPRAGGVIMWFGYESERRGKVYESVWLYCENEAIADAVAKSIRPSYSDYARVVRRDDEKGNLSYICIRSTERVGMNAFKWFCRWLSRVHRIAAERLYRRR